MSHVIEEYAKSCGVKISKAHISTHYYSIPFEKYIVVCNSRIPAKNYSYWDEALDIIKKVLDTKNIKIVQVIEGDEKKWRNADLTVQPSFKQLAFIIQHSLAFVGVDSLGVHLADQMGVPLLALYSNTSPKNCGPFFNKNNILIESERNGNKPSYSLQESPKTIDSILPEKISINILKLLKINKKVKHKTLHIGHRFLDECYDIIPSNILGATPDLANIRMDREHNEEFLLEFLRSNAAEVTIAKPIPEEILLTRRIRILNYIAPEFDIDFVNKVKALGITINLLCCDEKLLSSQRFKLFDFNIEFLDFEKKAFENSTKITNLDINSIKIKSNKKVIHDGIIYPSLFDYSKKINDFYLDLDWLMAYTTTEYE